MSYTASEIASQIQDLKDEFTQQLQTIVRMESPSTHPATMDPVFGFFEHQFREIGYHTFRIPGEQTAGQLLAYPKKRKKANPVQLLMGHCDTVWPLGTLEVMPCTTENGKMSGPGIYDMKAGLMEILIALKALVLLDITPQVVPVVFITSDEEVGSTESKKNILRLSKIANRCFVLEPALGLDGKIKTSRKGVGNYLITVQGKPAHSGLSPEQGSSAILEMSHIIQRLYELNDPAKGVTVNVGTIQGGERVNVIAARSSISVDVRIAHKEDARKIDQAIRSIQPKTEGVKVIVEGDIERPPMEKTEGTKRLWEQAKRLGTKIGLSLDDGMSGGASDGNLSNVYTPTLDGLGAVGDGAHAEHEHILIDETIQRTTLLTLMILEPCLS